MFSRKVIAATLAVAFAVSPAMAQTKNNGPTPYEKWDNSVRSMFFGTDLKLRTEQDIRTSWTTLPPERQAAIKLDCSAFPEPGSSDLTDLKAGTADNPVPGVNDQAMACKIIRSM